MLNNTTFESKDSSDNSNLYWEKSDDVGGAETFLDRTTI